MDISFVKKAVALIVRGVDEKEQLLRHQPQKYPTANGCSMASICFWLRRGRWAAFQLQYSMVWMKLLFSRSMQKNLFWNGLKVGSSTVQAAGSWKRWITVLSFFKPETDILS